MTTPLNVDRITLVWLDDQGQEHLQPLADVPQVGTLVDPETGEDLTLADHVLIDA